MSAVIDSLSLNDVEKAVEETLKAAHVYDIGNYGWSNAEDPDPDYIGHTMWQTDQPSILLTDLFGGSSVSRRPKDVEKEVLTLGEDFCGLMTTSRLSIGLTLLWERQTKNNFFHESTFFQSYHMDAYLKLAIASDRLRDLLIVACTGTAAQKYKTTRENKKYVTPFNDVTNQFSIRGIDASRISDSITQLPTMALAIYKFIDRRNEIVHATSTSMAKSMWESISELQKKYDN